MKKIFYISGMHCVSCEMLIEKEVKDIFKTAKIDISHQKGVMEIEAEEISEKKIREIVKSCGYQIVDKNEARLETKTKFKLKDFWQLVFAFGVLFFLVSLFSKFELARFFPEASDNVGLLVALGLGVVASLSTCLAITGGIVMSFSSRYDFNDDTNNNLSKKISFLSRSLPQIYFHIGRIGGFFVLGGLLGALGGKIQYSNGFTGFLTILVALIMLYIALNILGLLPSITKLGFYLPKKWSRGISSLQANNNPSLIASIGALTFFLPCGFTQSMQLAAVASGSFLSGALIMAVFALGTLPVLFSVGLGSSYSQNKKFGFLKKFIAAIIIFFALYSLNSGLIISGSRYSVDFWSSFVNKINTSAGANVKELNDKALIDEDGYQVVQLDVDYTFKQSEFKIKKDIPVKFIINAVHVSGCSDEVIIRRLGLTTGKLKNGDEGLIEFTPTQAGIIPFSCWMGMQNGRFIVE
ncbi:hypothetical protein GW758_00995 [Candidatus Falkowbacteria bacterium]|nr:hypothetical protein [Candidatus Falkowbacteria bacterium]